MHNLIEYHAATAQLLIRLVDCLLQLLKEAETPTVSSTTTSVKIDDIRRMLKRRHLPDGQRRLYQALYEAGDKGMNSGEIVTRLECTRYQLAGILGGLGLRVQGTEGLDNKGGIGAIMDISRLDNGDYHYRLKPLTRKALEIEKVV